MTNEFELEMNPDHIIAIEADYVATAHMINLAKEAASTPEDDQVIEWFQVKLDATMQIIETIKLNHAVTDRATFKIETEF